MDLGPEKRALLERAVADPASITPAEKNDILLLPPPDVESQLLQSTFNLSSRDALVAKALQNDGADLSYEEAKWLEKLGRANPFEKLSSEASINRLVQESRRPYDDRKLELEAQANVLTLDEDRARIHARNQLARLNEESHRAYQERRAEMRELHNQRRAKWVQEMVDAGLPRWGFVILRTAYPKDGGDDDSDPCSDAAWERFQKYFKDACRYAMLSWKGGQDLLQTHDSVWVSDRDALDGADTATLRARVRAMREAGEIPEGVRGDVFLVVDEDALKDYQFAMGTPISPRNPRGTMRPRAVDPDYDPSAQPVPAEGPGAGFDGEIAVPLPKVFDWLYYTFFAGSESWPQRYSQTKAEDKKDKGKEPGGSKQKGMRWWDKPVMPYPKYEY